MRKLIIVFILMHYAGYSQKYQAIDTTLIWNTEEVGKLMTGCYEKTYCKYYLKGYELNNGRIWNKVYVSRFSNSAGPWTYCTTYTPPASVYNQLFGYCSNDTVNKKVYFRTSLTPSYTATVGDIVYDFLNKNVGDTMFFKLPSMAAFFKYPITGIDSVLFAGKYHRRYLTDCSPSVFYLSNTKITFTEGIGSSLGVFTHTINAMGEYQSNLVCFANNSQTLAITNHSVYAGTSNCFNIALQTGNIPPEKDGFTLFPNPASSMIIVSGAETGNEYIIYNSIGKEIGVGTISSTSQIITENLPVGIYYLQLTKQHHPYFRKFLILR